MANSAIVTAIAAGLVRPNEYLGNVQYIPVVLTADAVYSAEALTLSAVLPANTKLIGIHLTTTAIVDGELDIGVVGDADSIIDGAVLTSAGDVNYQGVAIDVSSTKIVGTLTGTMSSDSIAGYILVANDE